MNRFRCVWLLVLLSVIIWWSSPMYGFELSGFYKEKGFDEQSVVLHGNYGYYFQDPATVIPTIEVPVNFVEANLTECYKNVRSPSVEEEVVLTLAMVTSWVIGNFTCYFVLPFMHPLSTEDPNEVLTVIPTKVRTRNTLSNEEFWSTGVPVKLDDIPQGLIYVSPFAYSGVSYEDICPDSFLTVREKSFLTTIYYPYSRAKLYNMFYAVITEVTTTSEATFTPDLEGGWIMSRKITRYIVLTTLAVLMKDRMGVDYYHNEFYETEFIVFAYFPTNKEYRYFRGKHGNTTTMSSLTINPQNKSSNYSTDLVSGVSTIAPYPAVNKIDVEPVLSDWRYFETKRKILLFLDELMFRLLGLKLKKQDYIRGFLANVKTQEKTFMQKFKHLLWAMTEAYFEKVLEMGIRFSNWVHSWNKAA